MCVHDSLRTTNSTHTPSTAFPHAAASDSAVTSVREKTRAVDRRQTVAGATFRTVTPTKQPTARPHLEISHDPRTHTPPFIIPDPMWRLSGINGD
jgi:hypothetical protein